MLIFALYLLLMHSLEPYYNWQHLYIAEDDRRSPFYGADYSEFEYAHTIYNYYIHPQWDEFGSRTLYMKILYADYDMGFVIIELIGEWNDAIENDIMTIRREVTDKLFKEGITKYIFIAENVLNFHSSDDSYYEEWGEQLEEDGGWVVILNLPEHSKHDFIRARLTHYIELLNLPGWRTIKPDHIFAAIEAEKNNRLPSSPA